MVSLYFVSGSLYPPFDPAVENPVPLPNGIMSRCASELKTQNDIHWLINSDIVGQLVLAEVARNQDSVHGDVHGAVSSIIPSIKLDAPGLQFNQRGTDVLYKGADKGPERSSDAWEYYPQIEAKIA